MEIVVLWIGLSFLAGVIASIKGRSGFGFFLLALLLSPLIGLIAAIVASEYVSAVEEAHLSSDASKKCPYCAELVKAEAKICRFCNKEFTVQDISHFNEEKEEKFRDIKYMAIYIVLGIALVAFLSSMDL